MIGKNTGEEVHAIALFVEASSSGMVPFLTVINARQNLFDFLK